MEKPTQLTKSIGFFYVAKDNETKTSELSLLLSQKKSNLDSRTVALRPLFIGHGQCISCK